MGNLLKVDELQIELVTARGVIRAVDGVSFCIDAGETVTIIGESGSGKSTTAMGILGLLADDLAVPSGSVQFKDREILGKPKALSEIRGKHIALIPQDPMTALSPVHTIGSQLRDAVRHSGVRGKPPKPPGRSSCSSRYTSRIRPLNSRNIHISSPVACCSAC